MLSRRQRRELALVVVLATLVAAAAVAAGRFDLVSGKRADAQYDKTYHATQTRVSVEDRIEGDWAPTSKGLGLAPGQSGTVTVRIQDDPLGRLALFLYGSGGSGLHASVWLSTNGRAFREVLREAPLNGARIDLPPPASAARRGDPLWVQVQARAATSEALSDPPRLTRVRLVTLTPPLVLPNLPLAFLLVLTCALAYLTHASVQRTGALPYSLAVLAGLAVLAETIAATKAADPLRWWELVVASQARDVYFLIPYLLLLVLLGWRAQVWEPGGSEERLWTAFALGGTMAWGASNRLGAFVESGWTRLNPDAITYMQLAESLRSPYDTMYREPLWIWMIKGWFWLVGSSAPHLRLLTGILSLAMVYAGYRLFRDYTGRPLVGLLVAALLAANPYLVSLSARGLREEAYILAILGMAYVVFVRPCPLSVRSQVVWLAVAGAAAHLLRFNSYVFAIPLLALWAWRQGPGRRRYVLVPLAVIAAVSAPHLAHNYQRYGDPLYSVNVHFVWSRNYEFVMLKQTGCEGCPSREAIEVDSTAGSILGAREYLFGLHTVREVVERTLQGYRDMYLRPTALFEVQSGTGSTLGFALYLAGLGFILMGPYREMLGLIVLLANGVPFAMTLDIDPRLGVHTAPFVAFILAYGMARCFEMAMRAWDRVKAGEAAPLPLAGLFRRWGRA